MIESKFDQLDETIQVINSHNLGVAELPVLVEAINHCFDEADFTYRKLSNLIRKDHQLSELIFKLVNSGIYKRPDPISNLDSALMLLGLKMIRNLIFSHKLKALLNKHSSSMGSDMSKRWIFTLQHGANAMELAKALSIDKPEEIFLAVIFSDIAAFIMADEHSENVINISDKSFYEKADEYKFSFAQKALNSWNFKPEVIKMMTSQNGQASNFGEMDVIQLAYFHMKENTILQDQGEFKKLPASAQLTYGSHRLLLLKDKEQDIQKMVASLI